MLRFIVRRLLHAVFTIFGVMLITFLLFRVVSGDVSANFVNPKLGAKARLDWLHRHGYDLPVVVNLHRRVYFQDRTEGGQPMFVTDPKGSTASGRLGLVLAAEQGQRPAEDADPNAPERLARRMTGHYVWMWNAKPANSARALVRPVERGVAELPADEPAFPDGSLIEFSLSDGSKLTVDLSGARTVGELLARVNEHPENDGRLEAGLTEYRPVQFFRSQFFEHLHDSVLFRGRSYATEQKLTNVIASRAKYSLAISIPALVLGWVSAMIISSIVAYFRDTWIDRVGVLISVLGMCVPMLAYMVLGQWLMAEVYPEAAWGLRYKTNIYVPVLIATVAGLGGAVRFYRTVILDEVSRDYVRTARAKGVGLRSILFKHVLKNCMLPILTNLVTAIPFLIMGSLLLERFFGVPGLGAFMIDSIAIRDMPMITGMTFLSAVLYVIALLMTDVLYAVFDPRIRLQ